MNLKTQTKRPAKRWHTASRWASRILSWTLVTATLAFAVIMLGARYWLLPNIENFRETIAREISTAANQRITIGKLSGRLRGVNLHLTLGDVVVFDASGAPALTFESIASSVSWESVVLWEPRFASIELRHPQLSVRRDPAGKIWVAGIAMGGSGGGGLADWLLRQERVVVRDGAITWSDEHRKAPLLELTKVDFRLDNAGRQHRFALRGSTDRNIAGVLDVRGDLAGRTTKDLTQWNGKLFAELDYVDIAAWRTWVQFPVSFPHGIGALRTWVELKQGAFAEVVADVQLAEVNTRLGPDLPELSLSSLDGRVAWKALANGFEFSTTKLGLMTLAGLKLQPADLTMRVFDASERKPAHGELRANALDLEPLATIAEHLPIDAGLRKELDVHAPRGSVYDLAVTWSGVWPQPKQYSVKGRFTDLAVNAVGKLPGFTGVDGNIDGNERGGTLNLDTQRAAVELPHLFRDKLQFDKLKARAGWTHSGAHYDIVFNEISFSNTDVAGSASGTFQTATDGRGMIDLVASLSRADARKIGAYIPVQVGDAGRSWLNTAFLSGSAADVKLKLKGNLDQFPFREGKSGIFSVTAKLAGVKLAYAPKWPNIDNVAGELAFHGSRMEIDARSGSILGVKLQRVRAEVPDLAVPDRVLTVSGEAEGATTEFLAFIHESPVLESIDRFTDGIRASGTGKLTLKLEIPLARVKDTKVAGNYQFVANQLQFEGEIPTVEQVNGNLEFTEGIVRVPNATMVMFGTPATLSAATQRDGATTINLAGRANVENLRRTVTSPWAQALQGTTDWKAAVTLRKRVADIVFDSSLQGIASSLPAPFSKAASDSVPLHIERRVVTGEPERIYASLGSIVSANLQRRKTETQQIIDRATINFGGGTAVAPERSGIWVTGTLKALDLDQWLTLQKSDSGTGAREELAGLDVKFGTLDLFGRRFSDLAVTGSMQGGNWRSVLVGRELVGEVTWRGQGRGKVTARMKNFILPAALPSRPASPAAKEAPHDLPALDIIADHFQIKDKSLGKLEVTAVPEGRDWKLERLRVTNSDATLTIDGVWQGWLTQPRTSVNLKLDVNDIGKLLARLGQPEGIRRGVAKLEGPLAWAGHPSEIDYATLTGSFALEAQKGQFVKLEPGIGKLLGILSLQSLPRRLTLDFRDIFSDGLAFDAITADVKVDRGIAHTDNFRIQGPAVRIAMNGDVNLDAETQRLRVKVFPSFSNSLSIAGALLGGPIAGIASFLVQKALKDPLDQIASHEYLITGSWADPQVAKVDVAPTAAAADPGTSP